MFSEPPRPNVRRALGEFANVRSFLMLSVPPVVSYWMAALPVETEPLTATEPFVTVHVPPKNCTELVPTVAGASMTSALPVLLMVRLPPASTRRMAALLTVTVSAASGALTTTVSPEVTVALSPEPGTPAPPQVAAVFQLPPPLPLLVKFAPNASDAASSIAAQAMSLTRIMRSPRTRRQSNRRARPRARHCGLDRNCRNLESNNKLGTGDPQAIYGSRAPVAVRGITISRAAPRPPARVAAIEGRDPPPAFPEEQHAQRIHNRCRRSCAPPPPPKRAPGLFLARDPPFRAPPLAARTCGRYRRAGPSAGLSEGASCKQPSSMHELRLLRVSTSTEKWTAHHDGRKGGWSSEGTLLRWDLVGAIRFSHCAWRTT